MVVNVSLFVLRPAAASHNGTNLSIQKYYEDTQNPRRIGTKHPERAQMISNVASGLGSVK
jgi:hypothetical protein